MVNNPKKPASPAGKEEVIKPDQQELAPIDQEKVPDNKEGYKTVERPVQQEKTDHQKIRETIEAMELDDSQAAQVQGHADDAATLADEEKINQLFEVAKKKGVVFAVHAAKKMNDPYVLDMLHDRLAKEGLYKEFLK